MVLSTVYCDQATGGEEMWWALACQNPKEEPTEIVLQFQVDTDPQNSEIRLAPYNPNSDTPVGDIAYTFSGEEAVAGLSWEKPDAEHIIVIDPQNAPAMKVATLVPGLWENGALVGVGEIWPSWVEGTIPDLYAANGIIDGWNGIYIDENHIMSFVDPLQIALPANLPVVESLALEGSLGEGAASMVGALADTLIATTQATASWRLDLTGAPESSETLDIFDATGQLATLVGFESPDTVVHGVCADGASVVAGWLDPAEDLPTGLERLRRGYQNGWNAFVIEESPRVVSATGLVAEAGCLLGE